jgi:hypothetical protein
MARPDSGRVFRFYLLVYHHSILDQRPRFTCFLARVQKIIETILLWLGVQGLEKKMTRRFVGVFLLVFFSAALACAQTQVDKDKAIKYLESTRQGVLDATAGLSEAQWNFKAGPDRWSIAQVAEHIAASEDLLMDLVTSRVMKSPARPAGQDVQAIDLMVLEMVPTAAIRFRLPIPLSRPIALVLPQTR